MTPEEYRAWESKSQRPKKLTKQGKEDELIGLSCLRCTSLGGLALLIIIALLAYKFLAWLIP